MPPPRRAYAEPTDEELFEAPLFPDDEAGTIAPMSAEEERALFEEPLFPDDDVPDAMGPPEPPVAEPDVWDFLTSKEGWSEMGKGATAAVQGASLNFADEIAPREWGDYMRKSAEDYPVAHGAGQMATGIAAGLAAPATLPMQAGVQGALSGLSGYFDKHELGEAATDAVGGAVAGGAGYFGGKLLAPGIAKAGEYAKRMAPRVFRESVDLVDPTASQVVRGMPSPEDMAGAPEMDIMARGGRPVRAANAEVVPREAEVVRGSMAPEDMVGPPMDITRRSEIPRQGVYEDPIEAEFGRKGISTPPSALRPQPLPTELATGPAPRPRGPDGRMRMMAPDERALRIDAPEPIPQRPAPLNIDEPPAAPRPPLQSISKPPTGPAEPMPFDPGEMQYAPLTPERAPMGAAAPVEPPIPQFDMAKAAGAPAPTMGDGMWDVARAGTHLLPGKYSSLARAGMDKLQAPGAAANHWSSKVARAGTEAAYELGAPSMLDRKVNAQDRTEHAYANPATTHYALSAVLSAGKSGLGPEDEAEMTRALVDGNDEALRATDFRLRWQNPAYARAVERELKSYQEENY
jgi:hypothetical protein